MSKKIQEKGTKNSAFNNDGESRTDAVQREKTQKAFQPPICMIPGRDCSTCNIRECLMLRRAATEESDFLAGCRLDYTLDNIATEEGYTDRVKQIAIRQWMVLDSTAVDRITKAEQALLLGYSEKGFREKLQKEETAGFSRPDFVTIGPVFRK